MEKAASSFLKYTVRVGEPYSALSMQEGEEVGPHFCCRNRQREAHTSGVSARTVSVLVLLACVITLMLLKCTSAVFFITVSPHFPHGC